MLEAILISVGVLVLVLFFGRQIQLIWMMCLAVVILTPVIFITLSVVLALLGADGPEGYGLIWISLLASAAVVLAAAFGKGPDRQ